MAAEQREAAPAVEVRGLCKTYAVAGRPPVQALAGLDFTCRRGEVFGLLGANGAGKTTALRILATIQRPTSGTARVDGVDVTSDPLEVRRRIGYLSCSTGLYARLTVVETLDYFGRLHGMRRDQIERRIEELLSAFELSAVADRRCEALSTGQRQRVSIARAVLHDPPVLILDEPTTGLDVLAAGAMIDFIEARRAAGASVLFSTHVLSEAERLCDRIGVIHAGRLLDVGTFAELSQRTGERWLEDIFRSLVGARGPA
jgi:sodium transport system ATP-binding protein